MRLNIRLIVAALSAVLFVGAAKADALAILNFSQLGSADITTATNNGAGSTTISATNIPVAITNLNEAPVLLAAFLDLTATSTSAATLVGSDVQQNYTSISFSICSTSVGCTINYLSGSFTDLGTGSGNSYRLGAGTAGGDTINFTSDVIFTLDLERALSFAWSNVTPAISIVGGSTSSWTSNSVTGTFSANIGEVVPEPASMVLLGSGLVGLAGAARRRRKNQQKA